MKTIAISIDEASLATIDRMALRAGRGKGEKKGGNRSEVVRRAVQEFIARQWRGAIARRGTGRLLAANRQIWIDRQARALVGEQADQ